MTKPLINNKYEVLKKIGTGGFGTVLLVYDKVMRTHRALKQFDPEKVAMELGNEDQAIKYSLIEEIRRAIDLDHKNIARYFDAFEYQAMDGIAPKTYEIGVMEYLPDGDLSEYAKKKGIHSDAFAKALVGVLEGLRYLHQKKIIHRDIKASNILFVGDIPKILDFGISKKTVTGKDLRSDSVLATLEYTSPEQISPTDFGIEGKIGYNLDLWMFGVMVFALLSGKHPFGERPEQNQETIRKRILSTKIEALDWHTIPERYQPLLKACLVKKAEHRAASAQELLDLLHKIPVAEPELETPTVPLSEIKPEPKSKKSGFSLAVLVGVCVIIGALVYSFWPPSGQEPKATDNNPEQEIVEEIPKSDPVVFPDIESATTVQSLINQLNETNDKATKNNILDQQYADLLFNDQVTAALNDNFEPTPKEIFRKAIRLGGAIELEALEIDPKTNKIKTILLKTK